MSETTITITISTTTTTTTPTIDEEAETTASNADEIRHISRHVLEIDARLSKLEQIIGRVSSLVDRTSAIMSEVLDLKEKMAAAEDK